MYTSAPYNNGSKISFCGNFFWPEKHLHMHMPIGTYVYFLVKNLTCTPVTNKKNSKIQKNENFEKRWKTYWRGEKMEAEGCFLGLG